ncbi:unnamed protein product [Rotaria sp. Silwood1]|nr:unnamed protein product [Rotaria sp. Silwood1]CAF1400081.1 unnamed protein product [Rotaria sp. Silwood1]CAF3595379.1 unnamed protein product [Rotaria sp. Silwood1]CAF4836536.1 unnamed protein product [Rotaria sp. Silwood1]CAF4903215.1 unnamed protein product [Rotaria sp. Silwood1]
MIEKNETKSKTSVPFWCSMRVIITFMSFLGMIIHFSQKTNVSIALVCMVNHSAIEHHEKNTTKTHLTDMNHYCLQTNKTNHIEGPYVWNKNIQGIILCSYFGGYMITQIPGGYLAGRYGARFLYSGAIFISSLATMFMPLATAAHWIVFSILQILVGLAHGIIWPCIAVIMAHWIPSKERGKLMGFVSAGAQIGNILILSFGGLMCSWHFIGGWPLIFYSTGTIGFVWALLWILIYVDSPHDHTYISAIEKKFILEHTQQLLNNKNNNDNQFHAPWRAILKSSACWALFIIHTCCNWGTYTFLTSIPKYMDEVLGFDIKSNGILSALLYAFLWLNINVSGIIADILIHRKILTITQTRKLFNTLGSFLPAIFVFGLTFMTCQNKYTAVILLTIGVTFTGCYVGGGFPLIANDIAPAYAGIVFGISNTFATIPGIISPYIVGALTEKDPNNWPIIFVICTVIYIIGLVIFLLIGSSELQPWAIKHLENSVLYDDLISKEKGETTKK